jgi:hypothetical protein
MLGVAMAFFSSLGVVHVCGKLRGYGKRGAVLCALSLLVLLTCAVNEADDCLRGAADGLKGSGQHLRGCVVGRKVETALRVHPKVGEYGIGDRFGLKFALLPGGAFAVGFV